MKNQHSNSILKEVGMFFDRRLNQDDKQNFLSKVDNDSQYRESFTREKNVRELLRTNVHRSSISPDLIKSIKDRIKTV